MTSTIRPTAFPDHTQLPDSDGTFVKNFQEHPQSVLLTDSIEPLLWQLHPDGQFAIGQDCGIYWREADPPERGAECPDWFYVPHVPATLDGQIRRSYVLPREFIRPLIVLEFASGDGSEERDRTPLSRSNSRTDQKPGKFWVYEQIIKPLYYGIFIAETETLEVYLLQDGVYRPLPPNARGHYEIDPMNVELGLWRGSYLGYPPYQIWIRWWDRAGNLLLTGHEQVEQERQRVQQEQQRADQERQKRQQLSDRLRTLSPEQLQALGIDPELLEG